MPPCPDLARPVAPVRRRGALAFLLAGALGLATAPATAQGPPPDGDWATFRTEHFRVTYQDGLEGLARHAAAVAERTHRILSEDLVRPPRGPIDLVVTDHVDFSNGFATPFTSNRIVVFARPPLGTPSLAFSRDWLELVVAHEIVHIFHLEHAGPVGRAIRGAFGRLPFTWPIFPALGMPMWKVEGLATYYESRLTGGGRAHGTYHDMVIRMAALEAQIPSLRQVSGPSPVWPGGERSYVYGTALMDWITEEYGHDAHRALLDATYGSVLPTFLFVDQVARRALGRSFTAIYDDWRRVATDSARALEQRLAALGITPTETLVGRGPYAVAPRFSPDGSWLSYAAHDYRSDPATRMVDLRTGQVANLARRNQFGWILGPAAWMPDGNGLVAAQLEYQGRYRMYSDLVLVGRDGRETRLTQGERLSGPDVAPDGRRIIAVQNDAGAIRLVEHELATGQSRVVAAAAPGDAFHGPRWSPDGERIAATLFAGGRVNIVFVDPETGAIEAVTDDAALAGAPAWSPDGQWLVFWSDRTGIPNLFAAAATRLDRDAAGAPALYQITNLLGGAFDPEVSPDGRAIVFASYHHDGWHLERIPFDPATWRGADPPVVEFREGLLPPPVTGTPSMLGSEPAPPPDPVGGPARPYSPLPTIRPYFWTPTYFEAGNVVTGQSARFLGVFSLGWDLLQRHTWSGTAAYDLSTGRVAGGGSWTWSGLGPANLTAYARRDWSGAGQIELTVAGDTVGEAVLLREDRVGLDARLWRRQWRATAWLGLSANVRRDAYQAFQLSDDELAEAGFRLRDLPTLASLSIWPGFSNARQHPYSISRQDGIVTSAGLGRWWNTDDGVVAYDQVSGSLAGFRGHRLWGFADHVTAARLAGILRTGDDARSLSIGGPPGIIPDLLGTGQGGTFLPVRGFQSGDRFGTRAWTASAEYRFPLHMPAARSVLGLSLSSVSGALFADAGHAWCTAAERASDRFHDCPATADPVLAAIGAEMSVTLGVLHGVPLMIRYGLAVPVSGATERAPVFHMGLGPSF
jgi:Tol biopolymer transport system component